MNITSEKYLESYLKQEVEKRGGLCWKWVSPGTNGVPDRIVLMPNNQTYYVELKSTGISARALQKAIHRKMQNLGHRVYVIDNIIDLRKFINEL